MIVKNYTGDKLNFGLAAQKAKAAGIRVNAVFVGDDLSVKGNGLVGRRGQQQWLPFESLEYGIGAQVRLAKHHFVLTSPQVFTMSLVFDETSSRRSRKQSRTSSHTS
jgi:hypothetical protein